MADEDHSLHPQPWYELSSVTASEKHVGVLAPSQSRAWKQVQAPAGSILYQFFDGAPVLREPFSAEVSVVLRFDLVLGWVEAGSGWTPFVTNFVELVLLLEPNPYPTAGLSVALVVDRTGLGAPVPVLLRVGSPATSVVDQIGGCGVPGQGVLRHSALDVPARSAHCADQLEVPVVDQIEPDDLGQLTRVVHQVVGTDLQAVELQT